MLNPDYRDMLSAFTVENVKYLLVGAYALAAYGHVRATGDIDLWVESGPENAARIMAALRRFGAPLHQVEERDFETPDTVFQIGVVPRRIDILTTIDAVDFGTAWEARTVVEVAGLRVPVISRQHLLQNKRSTGRPQDQADAMWLEED
ncbi:MAG: hypothetical protein M3N10_07945 [Actinomycetota bacterium]|nr:hypothetical protein [Actinomycetota bacterium]HZY66525.1 hypothetical protein [Rubrobacteraceae bacterium]